MLTYLLYLLSGLGFGYVFGCWKMRRELQCNINSQDATCPECGKALTLTLD